MTKSDDLYKEKCDALEKAMMALREKTPDFYEHERDYVRLSRACLKSRKDDLEGNVKKD